MGDVDCRANRALDVVITGQADLLRHDPRDALAYRVRGGEAEPAFRRKIVALAIRSRPQLQLDLSMANRIFGQALQS